MEPHIAFPDKTQADPSDTRPQKKVGRVFLNSEVKIKNALAGRLLPESPSHRVSVSQ